MHTTFRTLALGLSLLASGGCAVAVVAGLATTTALVVNEQRPLSSIHDDQNLRNQIHTAIVKNPEFHSSNIAVTSFNQVILLTGQTPNAALKNKAEQIAAGFPGVKRVYNETQITANRDDVSVSKDTWITTRVRSGMLGQRGLNSGSIKVVTDANVVYLMGQVDPSQADLAVDVARRTDGVSKVVKVFQYTDEKGNA